MTDHLKAPASAWTWVARGLLTAFDGLTDARPYDTGPSHAGVIYVARIGREELQVVDANIDGARAFTGERGLKVALPRLRWAPRSES